MRHSLATKRAAPFALTAALGSLLFALPTLIPRIEAASPSASSRIIKKLQRQIATLKKQLAAATATPSPFIEMVSVGNLGNKADLSDGDSLTPGTQRFGAVPYTYKIGKNEVSLTQYAAFLNPVAAEDPFGLYNSNMATDRNIAGINRDGDSGGFRYSVIGNGARAVTYVSWFDAARFCNWLHHGRPTGEQTAATTENGAYPLNGATSGGATIARNPGAKFWIPSEDEWYKAAYHQPSEEMGDEDNYWLYPTKSNEDPGNTIGVLLPSNRANFFNNVFSITQNGTEDPDQNYLTPAGSFPGSTSHYGTSDQGGNVFEWNDGVDASLNRGLRGGSWIGFETFLRSSYRGFDPPDSENAIFGFRVASP